MTEQGVVTDSVESVTHGMDREARSTAILYKAIRPDGTDFHTGMVQWAPKTTKARKGRLVKHPTASSVGRTSLLGWLLAPLVLADWLLDRHSLPLHGVQG